MPVKPSTQRLRKRATEERAACCPHRTVDAFNAFMELMAEARAEAAEMRRLYRQAAVEEDPRALGALNELKEKLNALDYHIPRVEEGLERLQGILMWFDRYADRVFDEADRRLAQEE